MMANKKIHFNAFVQNSPSPYSSGLWKHEKDHGTKHNRLDFWINLAQTLEKGKFDSVFIADVLGTYNTYNNSFDTSAKYAVQLPSHEPTVLVSAMAAATKHIGFVPTISTTYSQPYSLTRQLSTLDHLTQGRIGWNVVTSYLKSEAVNLGLPERLSKDERYNRADEFLEVAYKLWEESWEDGAVVQDAATDTYANPQKVHTVKFHGQYFDIDGPHLVEPSVQRTPVLFQAGASTKGKHFAAKHAEAVFSKHNSLEDLKRFVAEMEEKAEIYGRERGDIRVFPMVLPIVGKTEAEAYEKLKMLESYVSHEGVATLLSGHTGIDLSHIDPDDYVEDIQTDAIQVDLDYYAKDTTRKWTFKEALKHHCIGNGAAIFIGTKEQVADQFETWAIEGSAAGFNITQAYNPGTFEELIDEVIPILQERGLYRTEYEGTTLRENLYGKGQQHIKYSHPAQRNKKIPN